jgi:hypothetical protein
MVLTASEENQFLDITSTRIDEEIQTLCVNRALLRRRANALRDKTYTLPPETLTAIFECAVHTNTHPILNLAAVCFRWRRVIWASPSLWTTISLYSKQSGVWQLFDLHLENVKDASVSIHIPTSHGLGTPFNPILDLIRAAFTKCPDKTRLLDIGPIDKVVWDVIAPFSICADLPRLEAVKLNFKLGFNVGFEGGLFCRSPQLRSIEITKPLAGIAQFLPFHQITSLSLHELSPAYSLFLLSQCPNVVDFHSDDKSTCMSGDETFALETTVTLRNLQSLSWRSGEIPASATFITDIHLPSVHELFWHGFLDPAISPLWKSFFSTMLGVRVLDCQYSVGLLDLLACLPTLEDVRVRFNHFFDHLEEITHLISRLEWKELTGTLPYLSEFTISLGDNEKVMSKEKLPFQDALARMVTTRRDGDLGGRGATLRKLTVRLAVLVAWGTWHRRLVDSLREMGQDGLEVVIEQ